MGMRDVLRTLRPGDDRALAAELQRKDAERRRKAEAKQAADIKAMAERDRKRTDQERRESAERARRSKWDLARKGSGARLF